MIAKIKIFLLCIGMLAAANAFAVEPIALWDGDFSALKDFELTSPGGNTIENYQISITENSTGGVVYTGPNSSLNNCTFIIKGSGLDLKRDANQYLLALHQNILGGGNGDASYNKVGVALGSQNAGVRGIWENGYYSQNFHRADPFTNGGDIVINIQTSGGVYVYEIVSDDETGLRQLALRSKNTDLKSSNTNYKGFSIGGVYEKSSSTLAPAIGWTISKMAVFGKTLTEEEILGYVFPSEVIEVVGDTTVSKLNELVSASPCNRPVVSLSNGATIDVDEPFAPKSSMAVVSSGKVTLRADSMPDASYFSKVDFSGVHTLIRSWLNPGVVGFNFNANAGRNGEGIENGASDTSLALEIGSWFANGFNSNGSSADMFADGLTRLEWKSNNVYAESGGIQNGTFIQGYLDDGGNGVSITLSGVPYEKYDVIIYCSTDDANKSFQPKNVNGTNYTWDSVSGQTVEGTGTWGLASAAAGKAVYGANTLRINDLSGPLSIKGGGDSNNARGCISAFQIMPHGTSTSPMMTVEEGVASVEWTKAKWNVPSPPESGNVIITVYGDVELVVDVEVNLSSVVVEGEGSLKIVPSEDVRFAADSVSSAIPLILGNERVAVATISAPVKFLYKTAEISSSIGGRTYTAGEGSESEAVAIEHNGGSVLLDGGTYYLCQSYNGPQTTVVFKDADVKYSDACGVGMATYEVGGTSCISAPRLILSQGADGKTATMIVRDSAVVNVSGETNGDSNESSVMFGHWNGPSSFTIQDDATFSAASDVLVGKTANRQVINLDGGIFSASGIKAAGYASWENQLNLNGGILVLGQTGITSYAQGSHIQVAVLSCSELRASAAELPISQNVTINSEASLALKKVDGIESAIVKVSGTIGGSGSIDVGAGITLHLGVNRPEEIEISVEEGGALALTLQNKAEVPVLNVSGKPNNIILYDTDGTTSFSDISVSYDAEAGTITVQPPVNTWNAKSDYSFDNSMNWSLGVPENGEDVVIKAESDVTLSVTKDYALRNIFIAGAGTVTFVGEGSITAERLEVYSGTTYNSTGAVVSGETAHIVYGTLKTNGDVTLSSDGNAVDPSGVLDVESGTLTFKCGDRTLKGTVFVRRGATLAPQTTDAFNYGGTQEMHIYGTLAMGSKRWTTGGNNTIYLYGGSAVTGSDNTEGNIDFNAPGAGHIVAKRNDETGDSVVNFSAALRSVNNENGTIEVDSGVTLVMSGKLIDRQKITKRGAGSLVFDTPEGSEGGYIWVNEGTVGGKGFVHNITMAPRTVLQPELEGLSVNGFLMPEDSEGSIVLNSGRIDPERLSGSNYTLLTVKGQDSSLEADRINVSLGSRYESTISDKTISVTVKDGLPTNFLHYDFNNGATAELAAASDSGTIINYGGEADGGVSNGKSVKVCSGYTPYWGSYAANISPFASQEITVTTIAKMKETGVILWGLGNTNDNNPAFGLVALSANKVAIVTRNTAQEVEQMLTVDNTEDLTKGYHFFAIVANATGTTLYVDNLKSTTSKILPMNIEQKGQFGSFHGGAIGANKVSEDGFRLDDWTVYDAALKQSELRALRSRLTPRPFSIIVR